jgi:pyridoxine 5-phosphate synthase
MLKLGVNVDHVATLRQARGTDYPRPVEAARVCAEAGAHGLTVHLREDRRHIQDEDVQALCRERVLPVNLEMANEPSILQIALEHRPEEACLVPERREELTTEGGLNAAGQVESLRDTVAALSERGIRASLFIEADDRQIEAAVAIGAPCIELHTGTFCSSDGEHGADEQHRLIRAAVKAHELGLQVNAGHGINMENLDGVLAVPYLDTLNIGHSLVARAVFLGLAGAVQEMLTGMAPYTLQEGVS